jgi:TolB-like protein
VDSGNKLWSKPYQNEVDGDNIFEIQKEVALSVTDELNSIFAQVENE